MSILELTKKIAIPRSTGTEGERTVQRIIEEVMKKNGYTVKKEEVKYIKSIKYYKFRELFFIWFPFIIVLSSYFLHPFIIITLFVSYYIFKTKIYPKIELKIAADKTVNLIAEKNTKEPRFKIVICGHYDSAIIKNKYIKKRIKLTKFFLLVDILFAIFIFLLFINAFVLLNINKFLTFGVLYLKEFSKFLKAFTIILGIKSVIQSYFILDFKEIYSSGADDNASGITVMCKVAEALRKLNLKIGIQFIFFSAEEIGSWGSRNWINRHTKYIDKNKNYFINLDCVGRGKIFFVNGGSGLILRKKADPYLYKIIYNICNKLGYEIREYWGAMSDDVKLLENGLKVCSIMRANKKKLGFIGKIKRKLFFIPIKSNFSPSINWIHTKSDTINNIKEQKLKECVGLVNEIIGTINSTIG